jgi:hypothetical protein
MIRSVPIWLAHWITRMRVRRVEAEKAESKSKNKEEGPVNSRAFSFI